MIKPNLASGVEITGNLLIKLSGQGSVHIHSLESLDGDSTNTLNQLPVSDCSDVCDYTCSSVFHDKLPIDCENASQVNQATVNTCQIIVPTQNLCEDVSCQNPSPGNQDGTISTVETAGTDDIIPCPDNYDPSHGDANESKASKLEMIYFCFGFCSVILMIAL